VVALEGGVPVAIGGGVHQNCETRSISVHFFSREIRLPTVCSVPTFREWFVIIRRCVRVHKFAGVVSVIACILKPDG
jgi:hypothetical protein